MDMIKLDGAADFPEAVRAIARAGIPVFAQLGITPQTALQHGISYNDYVEPRSAGAIGGARAAPGPHTPSATDHAHGGRYADLVSREQLTVREETEG